jgi:hypothetical protein
MEDKMIVIGIFFCGFGFGAATIKWINGDKKGAANLVFPSILSAICAVLWSVS